MPPLKLAEFEQPLEPIEFADGRVLPVREFTKGINDLYLAAQAEGDDAKLVEVLRFCVPGLTDADVEAMTETRAMLIVGHCRRRLALTVEFLKNVHGGTAAGSDSPPSTPPTSSSTPSPSSPDAAAGTSSSN
jgi:hypothetical protein